MVFARFIARCVVFLFCVRYSYLINSAGDIGVKKNKEWFFLNTRISNILRHHYTDYKISFKSSKAERVVLNERDWLLSRLSCGADNPSLGIVFKGLGSESRLTIIDAVKSSGSEIIEMNKLSISHSYDRLRFLYAISKGRYLKALSIAEIIFNDLSSVPAHEIVTPRHLGSATAGDERIFFSSVMNDAYTAIYNRCKTSI